MTEINPQLENGYVRIANRIWEELGHYRLSGEEWLVLNCVMRKTYGFQKKEDRISLSQFQEYTGLNRPSVIRAIKKLVSKKILGSIKKDTSCANLYWFNKIFAEWIPSIKKDTSASIKKDTSDIESVINDMEKTSIKKDTSDRKIEIDIEASSINKDNQLVSKKIHTKDNIQKTYKRYIRDFQEKFIAEYNQLLKRNFRMTPKLLGHLSARLKVFTEDQILTALRNMAKNNFYLGSNDRGWFAHPEFLLRNDDQIDRFLNVKDTDGIKYANT